MRSLRLVFITCLVLISAAFTAKAQTLATATVTGSVRDSSGAVVPGAKVEIKEIKSGLTRSTVSNEAGDYGIVSVYSGTYNLTVTAPGFETYVVPQFTVEVSKSYRFDVALKLGEVRQTIEVQATAAAELQTLDATVGSTLSQDQLTILPSFDRDVMREMVYQPLVSPSTCHGCESSENGGAVAGARGDQNSILIDGGNANEDTTGSAYYTKGWSGITHAVVATPVESVEEFRMNTSDPTSTFNGSAGGEVMLVTKHGTNDFHGSAYWYHQNSALNANGWGFDHNNSILEALGATPNRKQPMKDNRAGASIGGPIWKNKTFFYFLIEEHRFPQNTLFSASVPSDSLRRGILRYRGYADGTGPIQSFDLKTSKVCDAGGNSPCDPRGTGISPVVSGMWNTLIPEPTLVLPTDTNFSTFQSEMSLPESDNTEILRLDHQFNEKWRFMGSVHYSGDTNRNTAQVDIGGLVKGDTKGVATSTSGWPFAGRLFVLGLSGQITPTFTNDFRWSFGRNFWQWGTDHAFPQVAGTDQAMSLFSDGSIGAIPMNIDTQNARSRLWNGHTTTWNDNATWLKGNHAVQFGAMVIHDWIYHIRDDKMIGALTYPVYHMEASTGLVFPDAYRPPTCEGPTQMDCLPAASIGDWNNIYAGTLGMIANGTYIGTRDGSLNPYPIGTPLFAHTTTESYNLYAGDTWKVKPSLTLSYGLTYKNDMPPHQREGKITMMVDPSNNKPWDAESYLSQKENAALQGGVFNPTLAFMPISALHRKYPTNPVYRDFGPRVAVAWNPTVDNGPLGKIFGGKKTVIRAGYGIVYDRMNGVGDVMLPILGVGFGTVLTCTAPGIDGSCHGPGGARDASNAFRIGVDGSGIPLPTLGHQALPIEPGVNAPYENNSLALDPKRRIGPNQQWTLSIQRALPGNTIFELGYQGRHATGLFYPLDEDNVPYMMTVGGQSFAKAFDAVAVQMRNGVAPANVAPQPFFETALGGAGSSYCGAQSCTATVAQNYTGNFIYPQISSMWDSLDSHWTFGPMLPQTKQVGMLYTMTSLGYSNYNAMYVQLRKAMAHGLTLNSNFTYGHSNDTAGITQDQNDTGSNAFHPEYDYGPSLFDHKFAFNLLGVYDLPFGRGHKLSGGSGSLGRGALNKIISGWSVAPVYSQESGAPTAVTPGMDPWGAGPWYGGGNMVLARHQKTTSIHWNQTGTNGWGAASAQGAPYYGDGANAFSNPQEAATGFRPILISQDGRAYGTSPNAGYGGGNIRSFPTWNLDMTLAKTTKVTERVDVRLTAECYNILNHVQWGGGGWSITNPLGFGALSGGGPARAIQLGLRIGF